MNEEKPGELLFKNTLKMTRKSFSLDAKCKKTFAPYCTFLPNTDSTSAPQ